MGKALNWKNFIAVSVWSLLLIGLGSSSLAQSFSSLIVDSTALIAFVPEKDIKAISVDRQGNFFMADAKGNVKRYNNAAQPDLVFSSPLLSEPSLLEAWNGLRIFLFNKEQQRVQYLDRFLTGADPLTLDDEKLGFPTLTFPSQDDNLWVYDLQSFSLLKYDFKTAQVLFTLPFILSISKQQNYEPTFGRAYENTLFLVNDKGLLLVLDNMSNLGNVSLNIGTNFFSLYKDFLLYPDGNSKQLIFNRWRKEKGFSISFNDKKIAIEPSLKAVYNGKVLMLQNSKGLYFYNFSFPMADK